MVFDKEIELIKFAEDKIEFEKIVKEKFEIGMTEMELIKKLSKQGFSPGWPYEKEPKTAVFVRSTIVCNSSWSVMWETDEFGNVNKIDGQYLAGCL